MSDDAELVANGAVRSLMVRSHVRGLSGSRSNHQKSRQAWACLSFSRHSAESSRSSVANRISRDWHNQNPRSIVSFHDERACVIGSSSMLGLRGSHSLAELLVSVLALDAYIP